VPAETSDCCEDIDGESFDNFEPSEQDRSFSTASSLPRNCLAASAAEAAVMRPVQVAAVESSAAPQGPTASVDCLSHHDPVYDRAVYGEQAGAPIVEPDRSQPELPRGLAEREADERLALFHRLMTPAAGVSSLPALQPAARFIDETRRVARAAQLWAASQVRLLVEGGSSIVAMPPGAAAPMNWDEYADLIDAAARPTSISPGSVVNAMRLPDVHSCDALLHSAASSLNRLGRLLQTAALELEGVIAPHPSQRADLAAP
jgi:hypothetical protein